MVRIVGVVLLSFRSAGNAATGATSDDDSDICLGIIRIPNNVHQLLTARTVLFNGTTLLSASFLFFFSN